MLWLLAFALLLAISLARRRRALTAARQLAGWILVAAALAAAAMVAPPVLMLRKLIGFVVMPTTVVWVLLVVLAVRAWREPRWRWPVLGTLLTYTLAGCPITAYVLTRGLERPFETILPLAGTETYDALLVMGGGTERRRNDEDGALQLGESGDRLRLAAALHAQGRAPVLVTSGSGVDGRRDVSAETASLLAEMGVPTAVVVRLPGPRNSASEVEAYARLVTERGWTKVGLVTSARHLPRVLALCRRQGLRVDPLPSDFRSHTPHWELSVIVPCGECFAVVEAAAWEYLGIAAVHLFGG